MFSDFYKYNITINANDQVALTMVSTDNVEGTYTTGDEIKINIEFSTPCSATENKKFKYYEYENC